MFSGIHFTPGTSTIKKARRHHNCCECSAQIEPEEHYEHITCMNEDHSCWLEFKTCWPCAEYREYILDWLMTECLFHPEELCEFGQLQVTVREYVG